MKKVFKFMGIIAAAAMTLVACNKEVGPQEQIPEGGYKYSFSILEDDTKAEIGDNSIVWVDGDQVGLIVGDYAGAGDVDVNVSPREVNFSSETAIAAGTMAYAYFPFDKDNDDASATTITLSDVQEGAGVSAMPLAGIPFEIQNAVAGNDNTNGAIKFLNLGSLINFKIFSTDEDLQSETISSVTFDADGDIAGSALIDLTAIDAANASSLAVVVVDGLTSVTVEQEESIPADKDDATPVKMVIFPGTFSGTVTVTTDVATYTKEIPSREFARSGSRTFGLDLAKAEREESVEPKFVKVTSDEELTSGNYLIVYEDGSVAFDGSLGTLDAVGNTIDVEIVDDEIEVNAETEAAVFFIDVEEGTIQSASGYYIGATSDANSLSSSSTTTYLNTVSIVDGEASIVSSKAHLRYNSSSNQVRFRYYKSSSYAGQKAIQLYKRVGGAAQFTTWNLSSIAVTTNPSKLEYTEGEVFDATGMVVTATYVDASDASNTKEEIIDNADLAITPADALTTSVTEVTITYKGVSTTLAISVAAAPETTIADVLSGGVADYVVKDVTVFAVKGSSIIIGDESAKMLAYLSDNGLKVGDVRTVSGTTAYYNTYTYQFSSPTFTGTGTTTVDHGTAVELDDEADNIIGAFADPYRHSAFYFHAIGDQDGRTITTTDGNKVYLSGQNSATNGKTVEVLGYVYAYTEDYDGEFLVCAVSIEEYVDPNAPVLTLNKTLISGVSANGVTNATETGVYTLENADDDDITVTPDGTVVTSASVSNGALTYTVAANTSSARNGSVVLSVGSYSETVTISQEASAGSDPVTNVDVLNRDWAGITGASYSDKTGLSGSASAAVYSLNAAGGNSSIQLRSKNSNSGIVSTVSGGAVKKVVVKWNTNTTSGNQLQVYGKTSAYGNAAELYNSSTQGTLIGTIVCGTSTELTISGNYTFIGLRSASGAIYLDEIDITWEH